MKFRLNKVMSSFIINAKKTIPRSQSDSFLALSISSISVDKSNNDDETNKNNILRQSMVSKIPKNSLIKINPLSPTLQLESDEFFEEIEQEEINIIHNNNEIKLISIDLFIFMVGEGNYFDNDFLFIFIEQSFTFISYERLIKKILNALKYFEKNQIHLINFLKIINEFIKSKQHLNEQIFTIDNYVMKEMNEKIGKENNNNTMINNNINIENDIDNENLIINKNFNFNILKYNSKFIAQVITNITYKNFLSLNEHLYEYVLKIDKSSYVNKIIDFSNKLSFFIIEDILSYNYKNERAKLIEKYIDIANELFKLKNYNDLVSFICIFSKFAIINLKETLSIVSPKSKEIYEQLNKFISFTDNYKNMRNAYNDCINNKEFFIPFPGFFSRDIIHIKERSKYVEKGLINIEKIKNVHNIISIFPTIFSFPNNINENNLKKNSDYSILNHIFLNLSPKLDENLDELSKQLEPHLLLFIKSHTKRKTQTESLIQLHNTIKYKKAKTTKK